MEIFYREKRTKSKMPPGRSLRFACLLALVFAANKMLLKNNGNAVKDRTEIQQGISYVGKAVLSYENQTIFGISKNLAACCQKYGKNASRNHQAETGAEYIKKAYQLNPIVQTQKMLGIAYARIFQYKAAQIILSNVLQTDAGGAAIKEYINLLKLKQ